MDRPSEFSDSMHRVQVDHELEYSARRTSREIDVSTLGSKCGFSKSSQKKKTPVFECAHKHIILGEIKLITLS